MSTLRWSEEQLAEFRRTRGWRVNAPPMRNPPAPAPAPAPAARPDAALGRLKAGAMNKTEARYAQHLEARRAAGEVAWWRFEGITLLLADRCRLTCDFAVMTAAGAIELHEVKGSLRMIRDDARVKLKVAADQFPFPILLVVPQKGGGWIVDRIGGRA